MVAHLYQIMQFSKRFKIAGFRLKLIDGDISFPQRKVKKIKAFAGKAQDKTL